MHSFAKTVFILLTGLWSSTMVYAQEEVHKYVNNICVDCSQGNGSIETVKIGEGSNYSYTAPYYNSYKYSTVQCVYTNEEIGRAGIIKSIAYRVEKACQTNYQPTEVKIYMGHRSTSTFSSTTDYAKAEDLTLVYEGSPKLGTQAGYESLALTTAFDYNGIDNLVVVVCKSASSTPKSLKYQYTTKSGMVLHRTSDTSTSYADISSNTTYQSSNTNRPDIVLGIALKGDVNGDKSVNILDLAMLIRILKGEYEDTIGNADVNVDNTVNINDVNTLVEIITDLVQ